jgi:outer membrane receptor protein involved in Fe transport
MVRGLTTVRNGIANASAATVFVDGIYLGGSSQSTELYNLERVEVLRGPQAALYGRNTYAGAINYVTRTPSEELSGEIRLTGAEHDTAGITGWLGGPIIDGKLGFFIAAGHRQYGGEYRNSRDGRLIGGEQSDDVTTKLRWTPTDTLDITIKAGLQKTDDEHFAAFLQGREQNNCCFRSTDAPRAREYFAGEANKTGDINLFTDLLDTAGGAGSELERQLASLNIDWNSPLGYTFTSVTGYVDDEMRRGIDSSYAAYDPFFFLPMPGSFTKVDWIEQSDFSQELRLRSPESRNTRWTTGLYYYRGEANTVASNQVFINNTGQTVVAPVLTPLTRDEIDNLAVFGGAEWDFIDSWTASAELRWATDRISVRNTQNYPAVCNAPDDFTKRFTSLTPRLTLSHRANEDSNYYLNVAKGTKPGDFNAKVPALANGCPDESFRAVDEVIPPENNSV